MYSLVYIVVAVFYTCIYSKGKFINYQLCEITRAGTLVLYVFVRGENN